MATLEDLIHYLSEGTVVLWVGAGASAGAGIPGHRALAQRMLERCRSDQRRNFTSIEFLYRDGDYPKLFDQVERGYSREFLTEFLVEELRPTSSNREVYRLTAELDADAYLTTNFEDLLFESVNEKKVFQRFNNSQADLSTIELGVTPVGLQQNGTDSVIERSDCCEQLPESVVR